MVLPYILDVLLRCPYIINVRETTHIINVNPYISNLVPYIKNLSADIYNAASYIYNVAPYIINVRDDIKDAASSLNIFDVNADRL
jgi:hypothetical protein